MSAIIIVVAIAGFFHMNRLYGKIRMLSIVLAWEGTETNNVKGKDATEPFHCSKIK
jgi:hypothetical protein